MKKEIFLDLVQYFLTGMLSFTLIFPVYLFSSKFGIVIDSIIMIFSVFITFLILNLIVEKIVEFNKNNEKTWNYKK